MPLDQHPGPAAILDHFSISSHIGLFNRQGQLDVAHDTTPCVQDAWISPAPTSRAGSDNERVLCTMRSSSVCPAMAESASTSKADTPATNRVDLLWPLAVWSSKGPSQTDNHP